MSKDSRLVLIVMLGVDALLLAFVLAGIWLQDWRWILSGFAFVMALNFAYGALKGVAESARKRAETQRPREAVDKDLIGEQAWRRKPGGAD